jgi:hypothetical protein
MFMDMGDGNMGNMGNAEMLQQMAEVLQQQEHHNVRRERRQLYLDVYKEASAEAIRRNYAPSTIAEMADAIARKAVHIWDEWLEEEDASDA